MPEEARTLRAGIHTDLRTPAAWRPVRHRPVRQGTRTHRRQPTPPATAATKEGPWRSRPEPKKYPRRSRCRQRWKRNRGVQAGAAALLTGSWPDRLFDADQPVHGHARQRLASAARPAYGQLLHHVHGAEAEVEPRIAGAEVAVAGQPHRGPF